MKKKYKALMLDLDGTTIPNNFKGRPSKNVKDAIEKARAQIHIGVATSRPYHHMKNLAKELNLSGPSIIHGGSQIMNFTTGEVYLEHQISKETIREIYEISKKLHIQLWIDEHDDTRPATEKNTKSAWLGAVAYSIISEKKADQFIKMLSDISEISIAKIVSWEKGCFDVSINHAKGTKQQAIFEVAKILGIETHEIIGVGDGYNDFPLLMACGLKIAMGNAVPELKAIADYVAPTVEEDGVADVIAKFIL
jgi:HAD superfamily hydrolase (TIGR01484 family)